MSAFGSTPPSREVFRDDLLAGETALITGGGTGIGREIALAFADHGADVAVTSRNMDHLAPVVDEVEQRGQSGYAATADVRDREAVEEMVDEVIGAMDEISILINNAGANFLCPAEEMTENGWRAVVGTILDGTANCSFTVGRHMIDRGGGVILSNGATNSERGAPFHVHSGAGKAGVHNLMKSLATEWGRHGIRCNTVAPGLIETEAIREVTGGGFPEAMQDDLVAGRFGAPEDCVTLFVYLASEAASYVTGGYFPVDGGHRLPGGDVARWTD